MMTQIDIRTRWNVLIFSRKTNNWSDDFCHDYLLYANATRSRLVSTYSESIRLVISLDVDFELNVSWYWSMKIIFFDFIDSWDRREDQNARKWDS